MNPTRPSARVVRLSVVAALFLLGLAAVPGVDLSAFWEALKPLVAHLHPALVHLPIGLLLVAGLGDLLGAMSGRHARSATVRTCLLLGLLGAGAAAGSGWVYAELDPPGRLLEDTLFYHRWTGIGTLTTAALSWLLYLLSRQGERSGPRRLSRVLLFACLVLVSLGGHLGGEMVYGESFLGDPVEGLMEHLGISGSAAPSAAEDAEAAPAGAEASPGSVGSSSAPAVEGAPGALAAAGAAGDIAAATVADPNDAASDGGAALFSARVQPIFSARCYECHGAKKQKGGLRLDRANGGLFKDAGLVVPGLPRQSELVRLISLPGDDLDVMPNKGDPLGAEQIEAIANWVRAGAAWPDG